MNPNPLDANAHTPPLEPSSPTLPATDTLPRFSHQSFLRRLNPIPRAIRRKFKKNKKSKKKLRSSSPSNNPLLESVLLDHDEEHLDHPDKLAIPSAPAPTRSFRRVFLNSPVFLDPKLAAAEHVEMTPSNKISTTKYTLITFLPKNLSEQFRRVANSFFLVMVLLQFIPVLEVADPAFAALPILFIVFVTAMKDGLEDFRRSVQDKHLNDEVTISLQNWTQVNHPAPSWRLPKFVPKIFKSKQRSTNSYMSDQDLLDASDESPLFATPPPPSHHKQQPDWQSCKWKDLYVGDVVLLRNNDQIPADIVVISTSELDNMCYVETKSLDGETNLKIRRGPMETDWVRCPSDLTRLQGVVHCDAPNAALYAFSGTWVLRILPSPSSSSNRSNKPTCSPQPLAASGRTNSDDSAPSIPADIFRFPSPLLSGDNLACNAASEVKTGDPDIQVDEDEGDDDEHDSILRIPLTLNSLLLRGSVLRNSEWVIGLVVYTGPESKIQLNAGGTPSKRTRIEKQMNPQIILNFVILFAMCLVCGITHVLYFSAFNFENAPFSLEVYNSTSTGLLYVGFVTFMTCVIIFQNLVPVSLYVTMELVKSAQAYFIHCDETMYDSDLDRPCSVRTWNLSDDLGQIEYIFSDKTGTLTRNIMELHKCSIAGNLYGDAFVNASPAERADQLADFQRQVNTMVREGGATSIMKTPKPTTFVDPSLLSLMKSYQSRERIFFLILGLCHTVLPEKVTDADANETTITYKAQSPDEEALVAAAQTLGITFLNRSQSNIVVSVLGEIKIYDVLEILEFTSSRKRMSIIIRDPDVGICVLSKGADSVIFERMAAGQSELQKTTYEHLQWFANDGYRTLCLAYRLIDENFFIEWHKRYQQAGMLITDREETMDSIANELETDLTLVGATAIEDKLQDQVPETIEKLISTGIKIWVLTGDKVETAITVGFSCNLLERDMTMIIIQGNDYRSTRRQLQQSLATLLEAEEELEEDEQKKGTSDPFAPPKHSPPTSPNHVAAKPSPAPSPQSRSGSIPRSTTSRARFALVIDGSSLKYAMEKENRLLFLEVGCRCVSVICCRVSPLQKAQVVALVRKELDCLSLAIGDGANDVSMIQEANVGIGIAGLEGYQAVLASDYSFAQFKFLQQLLLVHGRWSYRRIAVMNLTFFYKNVIWTFVLFWYQFFCGFSASINYEYSYVNYYNLFFTALPPMIIGVFDQDVPANRALAFPKLYTSGIKQSLYNMTQFWSYVLDALYQSLICYFVGHLLYDDAVASVQGWGAAGHYELGTVNAMCAITAANVYIACNFKSWSWIMVVGFTGNLILFPLYVWVYALYSSDSPIAGLEITIIQNLSFWLTVPLAIVSCILPRVMWEYYNTNYHPTPADIVRRIPQNEVAGDSINVTAHSGLGYWLDRLWHSPLSINELLLRMPTHAPTSSSQIQIDPPEEYELTPQPRTPNTPGIPSMLAFENLRGSLIQAMDSMRGFGRTQRERLLDSHVRQHRPSFFMYMDSEQSQHQRRPNTGFAFSGDDSLPALVRSTTTTRRRPRDESVVNDDTRSDSHVQLYPRRTSTATPNDNIRRRGHARVFSI